MRNRLKNRVFSTVTQRIGRLYDKLYSLCCRSPGGLYGGYSHEDIFHDTICYMIQDGKANKITNDEEFIKYFVYRHRMISFQIIKDAEQLKQIEYADHIQAKKGET